MITTTASQVQSEGLISWLALTASSWSSSWSSSSSPWVSATSFLLRSLMSSSATRQASDRRARRLGEADWLVLLLPSRPRDGGLQASSGHECGKVKDSDSTSW